jgi:energy-coupling factor transporter transmembrane protein EcfT
MAELGALNYQPGDAFLHRFDVRLKLVTLIMISLVSVKASALGLALATLLVLAAAVNTRLPLMRLLSELRYFVVFLFFVCLARALTVPGETVWRLGFVAVSREGLVQGALIGWRLALVVLLGALLVATSRSADIRAAIEWFLKPLPGIPHKRIGTMIGLMVRFIPVAFDQVQEILEAQRARGVENRKNPLYRLPRLLNPTLRKTFARADELAIAMEARCYTENRTDPHLVTCARDWFIIGGVTLICVAMYLA